MPHINLIAIGKLKKGPLFELKEEYLKRIRWPVKIHEIESKQTNPQIMNEEENEKLLEYITPQSFLIVMDETGKTLRSKAFSKKLEQLEIEGTTTVDFIIGGADGLSTEIKKRANLMLSFGQQTWPHMLARIMLLEQIYRAQQIQAGHPYHRE